MAKSKVSFNKKNISQTMRRALRAINLERIGRVIVTNMKKEIRKGMSPATGRAFKPLAKKTIDRRKKLSRVNRTHKDFSPSKSNITFKGSLVNALSSKKHKQLAIKIFTKATRRPRIMGLRGKYLKQSVKTNKELQKYVEEKRPYVGLSKSNKKKMSKVVANELKKTLRKFRKGR